MSEVEAVFNILLKGKSHVEHIRAVNDSQLWKGRKFTTITDGQLEIIQASDMKILVKCKRDVRILGEMYRLQQESELLYASTEFKAYYGAVETSSRNIYKIQRIRYLTDIERARVNDPDNRGVLDYQQAQLFFEILTTAVDWELYDIMPI
ncbi:hypothetical protein BO71DRAFT_431008 [Aspergillus ellipticus CBS 707.79]|uniref:Uncharacterized protein n=1 Tax=Aspergillus ellipticus CBS 707.79 TaxID=1448320 RepID=A0A319DYR0_9EURO|nr:hypothetical protein BO71DRAFT_431008 [Aspergillus ellipticus CBS 707.79]